MNRIYLILLSFFLSCFAKENAPFYFLSNELGDTPTFFFEYGLKEQNTTLNLSDDVFHYENGVFCVYSIPLSLYNQELGGKFRICWKMNEEGFLRLKNGFSILDSENPEYPHFTEIGKNWVIKYVTFEKWKEKREEISPVSEWKKQIWSNGFVTYQSYAIPHPIFLQKTNTECEVVFRSLSLKVSENKTPTLVFEFPCPEVDLIYDQILSQNQTWFSECQPNNPTISEIFRHSESDYKRYMEWENQTDRVICPVAENLEVEKNGEIISFQSDEFLKRSRLILPHAILLFSDEPKFQGIPIPKEFLSELGTNEVIRFGDTPIADSPFSFKQGREFFSKQWNSNVCRDQKNIWISKESFCGNPGLPNGLESKHSEDTIPSCSPDQIKLTEFYPGNQNEKNFPLPAFFEFQNLGNDCDLSSLNWNFDESVYPFSAKEEILKQNSIFLFTREEWVGWDFIQREKPFYIPKQVFQIPPFSLEHRKSKELIHFLPNPNQFQLVRRGNRNQFSIYVDSIPIPHPRTNALDSLKSFGFQMSPGKHERLSIPWIGSKLLEFAKSPHPFIDFGFFEWEEGVSYFITTNGQEYYYWKPKQENQISFAYEPNLCIREDVYHLPSGFFSNQFSSLFYSDKDNLHLVGSVWSDLLYREKSYGDTHSLHPEPAPILFSSSLVASQFCSGLWRSPGYEKERSLEIVKQGPEYNTNLPFEILGHVQYGNLRQKSSVPLIFSNNLQFKINITGVIINSNEEQMYSYFTHPKLIKPIGFLEKKGPIQIEAVYPNPFLSQNEWIYICNRSNETEDLSLYQIEDETSVDDLVPYQTRFPELLPKGKNGRGFVSNDSLLPKNTCAWIVDPDGKEWYLPMFHTESDRLFTVSSTQTIGNGISSGESLQLRKKISNQSILISSFGHKESTFSFSKTLNTGEFLWLKKDTDGVKADDFEVYREDN